MTENSNSNSVCVLLLLLQVVIDGETFKRINTILPQLSERVAEVLQKHTGKAPEQVNLGGLTGLLRQSMSVAATPVRGAAGFSADSASKACMAQMTFGSEVSVASSQLPQQQHRQHHNASSFAVYVEAANSNGTLSSSLPSAAASVQRRRHCANNLVQMNSTRLSGNNSIDALQNAGWWGKRSRCLMGGSLSLLVLK
jgi:hypothetical protein